MKKILSKILYNLIKRHFSLPQYENLMKTAPFPVRVCQGQAPQNDHSFYHHRVHTSPPIHIGPIPNMLLLRYNHVTITKSTIYVDIIRIPQIHIGPIANMLLLRRNHVTKSTTTSIGLIGNLICFSIYFGTNQFALEAKIIISLAKQWSNTSHNHGHGYDHS